MIRIQRNITNGPNGEKHFVIYRNNVAGITNIRNRPGCFSAVGTVADVSDKQKQCSRSTTGKWGETEYVTSNNNVIQVKFRLGPRRA